GVAPRATNTWLLPEPIVANDPVAWGSRGFTPGYKHMAPAVAYCRE
ncbi:hypothetical protein SAMN05216311_112175, partial [Chitinophaga sp. CF418]